MVNFILKNIPDGLYQRLKEQARQHHRSLNSEILICLTKAVGETVLDVNAVLRKARTLRKTINAKMTDSELQALKHKDYADAQIAKDRFNDPKSKIIVSKELRKRFGV